MLGVELPCYLSRGSQFAFTWAQKEIAICDEYLLPLLRSQAEFQAGWAIAQLGEATAGIAQMERGVQAIRATGADAGLPYLLGLLAKVVSSTGQRDRALSLLDQAIGSAKQSGTHFLLSEVLRSKAEVLAQAKDHNSREIDELLRGAIDIATQNATARSAGGNQPCPLSERSKASVGGARPSQTLCGPDCDPHRHAGRGTRY
jgi:predicted ATPase